jgi:predicted RNA-binding protein (virulence factor B family)
MADIGKFNNLEIIAVTENGLYLDAQQLGEVLLPKRLAPDNSQVGDSVKVFIYLDSADRFVATTETPKAEVDQFANLKVVDINRIGAFLDWGLSKDLLVPFNHQQQKMELGKHYLVKVSIDPATDRIIASSKIDRYLDIWPANYCQWQQVSLVIGSKTDLGFKAIIDNSHWGLLYDNEIFQRLRVGQKINGYVKKVREDGRIDLILTRPGKGKVKDFTSTLLDYLQQHDGFCPLHDKSSPDEINRTFAVSKKNFKSTVGHLLKQGKIILEPKGIRLKNG